MERNDRPPTGRRARGRRSAPAALRATSATRPPRSQPSRYPSTDSVQHGISGGASISPAYPTRRPGHHIRVSPPDRQHRDHPRGPRTTRPDDPGQHPARDPPLNPLARPRNPALRPRPAPRPHGPRPALSPRHGASPKESLAGGRRTCECDRPQHWASALARLHACEGRDDFVARVAQRAQAGQCSLVWRDAHVTRAPKRSPRRGCARCRRRGAGRCAPASRDRRPHVRHGRRPLLS